MNKHLEQLQKRLEKEAFKNISRCVRLMSEVESMIMIHNLTQYTFIRSNIEDALSEVERLKRQCEYALIKIQKGEDAEE